MFKAVAERGLYFDHAAPVYTRDELLALHRPCALPEYLPLIDGVSTRHSLSPALLDPFDPEEVSCAAGGECQHDVR